MKSSITSILVGVIFIGVFVTLFVLIVRAFLKYLKSSNVRKEKAAVSQSLGETLKAHRTRCQMTQEFVAETIGVSRQAVTVLQSSPLHRGVQSCPAVRYFHLQPVY